MLYELKDVTKRYTQGRRDIDALAGIDLTVDEGEFLAIQGSTGSGKTTLLQMLGALDQPSGGAVVFDGRDMARLDEGDLPACAATPSASSSRRSTSSRR